MLSRNSPERSLLELLSCFTEISVKVVQILSNSWLLILNYTKLLIFNWKEMSAIKICLMTSSLLENTLKRISEFWLPMRNTSRNYNPKNFNGLQSTLINSGKKTSRDSKITISNISENWRIWPSLKTTLIWLLLVLI